MDLSDRFGATLSRTDKMELRQVDVLPHGVLLQKCDGVEVNDTQVCLLVACLTSQQHASVSRSQICSDNFACCHVETDAADQTFYLTQSHSILTPGPPVPALTL